MRGGVVHWAVAVGILAAGSLAVGSGPVAAPAVPAAAQKRVPQPPPPRTDSVEELERKRRQQEEAAKREQERRERAARADRREALRQLQEDLGKMHETLKAFEAALSATNPDQELSLALRQQSEELEKLAKRIRKNAKLL